MKHDIDHLDNLLGILGLETVVETDHLRIELGDSDYAKLPFDYVSKNTPKHVRNITELWVHQDRLGCSKQRIYIGMMPSIAVAGICYGYSKL